MKIAPVALSVFVMGGTLPGLAACSQERDPAAAATAPERNSASPAASSGASLPPAPPPQPERQPAPTPARKGYLAEKLTIAEWRKADNFDRCMPIALLGDLGQPAKARRAEFSGGWAVAFDQPGLRSAYGIAGAGLDETMDMEASRNQLQGQWPHLVDLGKLPRPSFAGYGVVGAQAYPAGNPQGIGLHSVAYLRIGGQKCLYNIWSNISRAHLEQMLDTLRVIEKPNG